MYILCCYCGTCNAISGCRKEEEIKAFWSDTPPCSANQVPCVDVDNGHYFTGGYATRVCSAEGEWLPPDYSSCAVKKGSKSFALFWMTFTRYSANFVSARLDNIKEDVSAKCKHFKTNICSIITLEINKILKFKKGVGIAIKSKELAI